MPEKLLQQQSDSSKENKKISRRKFLSFLGASGGATLAEIKWRPWGKLVSAIEDALRGSKIIPEANPLQIATRAQELLIRYLNSPTQENVKLFAAWLKFNGAILYGTASQRELASVFAKHFLYGEGREFDLTEYLLTHIDSIFTKEQQDTLGIAELSTPEEKWQKLYQDALASEMTTVGHVVTDGDKPENRTVEDTTSPGVYLRDIAQPKKYYVGRGNESLMEKSVQTFAIFKAFHSQGIWLGLGSFTGFVSGKVQNIESSSLTLANPFFELRDRYDWSRGTEQGAATYASIIVQELNIEHLFNTPELQKLLYQLDSIRVDITDDEGALLVEKGFADNFDIHASWKTQQPFELRNLDFVAPPQEFQHQNNTTITRLQ